MFLSQSFDFIKTNLKKSKILEDNFNTKGIRQLFKEIKILVPSSFLIAAFYFGTYDTGKRLYYGSEEEAKKSCFLTRLLFAQIITAVFGTLVYPFVKIQHRLMVIVKYPVVTSNKCTGIFDCAQKIITNEGSYSLFQGNSENFYKWLYWSLALVLYDEFQKYF